MQYSVLRRRHGRLQGMEKMGKGTQTQRESPALSLLLKLVARGEDLHLLPVPNAARVAERLGAERALSPLRSEGGGGGEVKSGRVAHAVQCSGTWARSDEASAEEERRACGVFCMPQYRQPRRHFRPVESVLRVAGKRASSGRRHKHLAVSRAPEQARATSRAPVGCWQSRTSVKRARAPKRRARASGR